MLAQALKVRSTVLLRLGLSESVSSAARALLLPLLGVSVMKGVAEEVGIDAPTALALELALKP